MAALSATSAEDIEELSRISSENVGKGTRVIDIAYTSLDKIMSGMKKMNDNLLPLKTASEELSKGISEVVKNSNEVTDLSKTNVSATSEILASINQCVETVRQITKSTEKIDHQINSFKVK